MINVGDWILNCGYGSWSHKCGIYDCGLVLGFGIWIGLLELAFGGSES